MKTKYYRNVAEAIRGKKPHSDKPTSQAFGSESAVGTA